MLEIKNLHVNLGTTQILRGVSLSVPKGAIVGLQWALYMHGFGGEDDLAETHPEM